MRDLFGWLSVFLSILVALYGLWRIVGRLSKGTTEEGDIAEEVFARVRAQKLLDALSSDLAQASRRHNRFHKSVIDNGMWFCVQHLIRSNEVVKRFSLSKRRDMDRNSLSEGRRVEILLKLINKIPYGEGLIREELSAALREYERRGMPTAFGVKFDRIEK